jgi:hypothetical protein
MRGRELPRSRPTLVQCRRDGMSGVRVMMQLDRKRDQFAERHFVSTGRGLDDRKRPGVDVTVEGRLTDSENARRKRSADRRSHKPLEILSHISDRVRPPLQLNEPQGDHIAQKALSIKLRRQWSKDRPC